MFFIEIFTVPEEELEPPLLDEVVDAGAGVETELELLPPPPPQPASSTPPRTREARVVETVRRVIGGLPPE
jgi:hypothetical protein